MKSPKKPALGRALYATNISNSSKKESLPAKENKNDFKKKRIAKQPPCNLKRKESGSLEIDQYAYTEDFFPS